MSICKWLVDFAAYFCISLPREKLAYNWLLCYYELEIIGVMGRSVSRGYKLRLGWFGLKFSNLSRVVAHDREFIGCPTYGSLNSHAGGLCSTAKY